MKKILAIFMTLVMVISLVACGAKNPDATSSTLNSDPTTEPTVNETPNEEIDTTTPTEEEIKLSESETILLALFEEYPGEFPVMTWKIDISDADAVKAFAGLSSVDNILEISVTEPAMGAQAYSIVLVKLADGADAEAIAKEMKDGVDTRKWICVEADTLDVVVVDNFVLLAMMSSEFAETINVQGEIDAFVEFMKTYEPEDGETTAGESEDSNNDDAAADEEPAETTEAAESTEATDATKEATDANETTGASE